MSKTAGTAVPLPVSAAAMPSADQTLLAALLRRRSRARRRSSTAIRAGAATPAPGLGWSAPGRGERDG